MRRSIALVRIVVVALVATTVAVVPALAEETRTLVVSPDTDLVDGQVVALEGSGYTPGAIVFFCQGVSTLPPTGPDDCGSPIGSSEAGPDGSFSATFAVQRVVNPPNLGQQVDCAQPDATCAIGASDFLAATSGFAVAPITFLPQDPLPAEARIVGQVRISGTAPPSGTRVQAYAPGDVWIPRHFAVAEADGTYAIEGVDRGVAYRIRVAGHADSTVPTAWHSSAFGPSPYRLLASTVSVPTGADDVTVNIDVPAGGTITGTVRDHTGAPLPGVAVTGYAPLDRWVGTIGTQTAADGTFALDQAWSEPFAYRLRFEPWSGSGSASTWYPAGASRSEATWVSVPSGGTTAGIDVVLPAAAP